MIEIINSYKDNFTYPIGAYAYLLLNQKFPEIFVISTEESRESDVNGLITDGLKKVKTIEDIKDVINTINSSKFSIIETKENIIDKNTILKTIDAIKYINIDDWDGISGIVEYNNFDSFVAAKDKNLLISKMNILVKDYGFKSVSLNPLFKGVEFIDSISKELEKMTEVLGINKQSIGLKELSLNYQTEEGDFTGYVSGGIVANKMVIKKKEVFAHEWLHFIDSSLGYRGHPLTTIMSMSSEYLNGFNFEETNKFEKTMKEKSSKNEVSFSDAIVSLGHFFEKYALDKKDYYKNLKIISKDFEINRDTNILKKEIKKLLNDGHPARYFSFIEAQCEIYKEDKHEENNQFLNFAKKADKHLGENDYTISVVESFARTFEAFLLSKSDKMEKCVGLVPQKLASNFYPQDEMLKKTNEFWEKSWSEIRTKIDKISVNMSKFGVLSNIERMRVFTDSGSSFKIK